MTNRTGRMLAATLSSAATSPTLAQDGSPPSSLALVRPEIMRSSTSVSHAKGSTPFSCVPCEGALVPWVQVPPGNSRSSRKHPERIRR